MGEGRVRRNELAPGAIPRSEPGDGPRASTMAELDEAADVLAGNKRRWAALPVEAKIALLDDALASMWSVAEPWVARSLEAKGTGAIAYSHAEEWAFVANIVRMIRLLRRSLRQVRRHGRPLVPGGLTTRDDRKVIARVFPQTPSDRLLLPGTTADVWMQPGATVEEVLAGQARCYRQPPSGKVVLVLGAGNASMLVPSDLLYKLFVEGGVVLLKLNPVNAYLGPLLERGFRALIGRGFLRVVHGGVREGAYLCEHRLVDELHTTGSDKTYESIMFGSGEEGRRRKAARSPRLAKRFTCELGNVTPVIVVPGRWTSADIAAQAEKLARWLVINGGFNCLTPRVLVQWAGWPQRAELDRAIAEVLARVPTRPAWYPGAAERHARFLEAHPEARLCGAPRRSGHLPWTLVPDVGPDRRNDVCFRNESFCGLLATTALDADDEAAFLERAVGFANDTLWGNLTATLVAHPTSLSDAALGPAIERALADLRYGMVLVNQFAGLGFFAVTTTWGAFPGNPSHDIQSGLGVTSNSLMFDRPQKSVVRSPFRLSPDPFALTSKNAAGFTRRMARMEYAPSLWKVPGLLYAALRS